MRSAGGLRHGIHQQTDVYPAYCVPGPALGGWFDEVDAPVYDRPDELRRHQDTDRHTHNIGHNHRYDADDERVPHLGHAPLDGLHIGVVVRETVGVDWVILPGARLIGGGVQVIRALLLQSRGEGHGREHIGALGLCHGGKHVDTRVYYRSQGYTVERLDAVMTGRKLAKGGQQVIFAHKDHPLTHRLWNYLTGLVVISPLRRRPWRYSP